MILTICTPTFNRAHTLERTYESLVNQKIKKFEWIIVDDGSEDDTEELVKSFIAEKKITIKYLKQSNQGKHIALNKGMDYARGQYFTCLDSDDWYYTNTLEIVVETISKIKNEEQVAGFMTIDTFKDGSVVGTDLRIVDQKMINWIDLIYSYGVKGDKDYYFKTSIIKQYKFKSYPNNRHMPPSYQYYLISREYNLYMLNQPTKYVEYLDDGISKNKYNKYIVSPDNFSLYRKIIMDLIPTRKRRFINAIHFNATQYLGTENIRFEQFKYRMLAFITKPLGRILASYIKRNANMSDQISHKIGGKK